MKNFLIVVLAALCCLLLGAFCWGVPFKWPHRGPTTDDSIPTKEWVIAEIAHQMTPEFDDVDMLLHYQYLESRAKSVEAEFLSMPPEILKQVGTVCINRDGYATMESIVLDYNNNKQIYNNLAPPNDNDTATTVDPTDNTPTAGTSGGISHSTENEDSKSDTITVNGKKYHTL